MMDKEGIPVRMNNVAKSYGDVVAIKKVSFGLEYGECFALLGVSGAGKTTLLAAKTTLVAGNTTLFGESYFYNAYIAGKPYWGDIGNAEQAAWFVIALAQEKKILIAKT